MQWKICTYNEYYNTSIYDTQYYLFAILCNSAVSEIINQTSTLWKSQQKKKKKKNGTSLGWGGVINEGVNSTSGGGNFSLTSAKIKMLDLTIYIITM